jgi:hypothetical protein
LVRSLREIGVRIDEHYQESIHDRHHAWEPGKETKLFHHCSYSADAQAIKVFLPLIEHHGETLIDQILSSKGAKQ